MVPQIVARRERQKSLLFLLDIAITLFESNEGKAALRKCFKMFMNKKLKRGHHSMPCDRRKVLLLEGARALKSKRGHIMTATGGTLLHGDGCRAGVRDILNRLNSLMIRDKGNFKKIPRQHFSVLWDNIPGDRRIRGRYTDNRQRWRRPGQLEGGRSSAF